jgi:hypothetical protein
MIVLPSLKDYTKKRPRRPQYEEPSLVPDFLAYPEYWKEIKKILFALSARSPLVGDILKRINTIAGFFGSRLHPVTLEPHYYHIGVEVDARAKQQVKPILNGILEYSGYGVLNGYYVLLSHPQIQTEDGYILHTMYCHLKKPLVKFNSYQKMLREISLGSYPLIDIDTDTVLGLVGSSGDTIGDKPKLYLQCDFRKYGETSIAVDPMNFYSPDIHTNESKYLEL